MKNKIPNLKTSKEAAKFWDTNDVGDFMNELKIVEGVYSPEVDGKDDFRNSPKKSLKDN